MSDTPTLVPIPGGSARLRPGVNLPERYRRPIKALVTQIGESRMRQIVTANSDSTEGLTVEIALTEHEANVLMRITDAVIYALVESWTLDLPLPDSPAAVQDLPGHIYDALAQGTAKEGAAILAPAGAVLTDADGSAVDTFTVDAVEDPASPTGASAD